MEPVALHEAGPGTSGDGGELHHTRRFVPEAADLPPSFVSVVKDSGQCDGGCTYHHGVVVAGTAAIRLFSYLIVAHLTQIQSLVVGWFCRRSIGQAPGGVEVGSRPGVSS